MKTAGEHVTITEITDLIAWARHLSAASPGATSPAELAAFHAAKTDLLARIGDQHAPHATTINTEQPHPRKDIR
jgi:hypothetical protein